jgi:hypothetical protein
MALKFANNASSTLASSIIDTDTTLSVQAGDAAKFPVLAGGDWFPLTVVDAGGNMEIMRVTARSGAVLTVTRGQEGTTAMAFDAGVAVQSNLTAGALDQIQSDILARMQASLNGSDIANKKTFRDNTGTQLEPGLIAFFGAKTAPQGWLAADGAAVEIATYPDLDAAIYVGDPDNATAPWGYRTTSQVDPTNNRSTTGDYIVLPDINGPELFIRGWDSGSGRIFGSAQDDQNKQHSHTASSGSAGAHTHSVSGSTSAGGAHDHGYAHREGATLTGVGSSGAAPSAANRTTSEGNHSHSVTGTAASAGAHTHSVTVANEGGSEARPKNVALLACIKA